MHDEVSCKILMDKLWVTKFADDRSLGDTIDQNKDLDISQWAEYNMTNINGCQSEVLVLCSKTNSISTNWEM